VRADCGRVNGDGGGIVTVLTLVRGAVLGGSSLPWSQLQQLLALDEAGDRGEFLSAGAEVEVKEVLEADDVTEAMEVGRLPSKTNLVLVPVGIGLMMAGDSVLRKSR
jgi:hypothetical protein